MVGPRLKPAIPDVAKGGKRRASHTEHLLSGRERVAGPRKRLEAGLLTGGHPPSAPPCAPSPTSGCPPPSAGTAAVGASPTAAVPTAAAAASAAAAVWAAAAAALELR